LIRFFVRILTNSFRPKRSSKKSYPSASDAQKVSSAEGSSETIDVVDADQLNVSIRTSVLIADEPTRIVGPCYVVDGDTIRIGKENIRLAGIDAPELAHPWGKKAKWELVQLCKGQTILAEVSPELSYERIVATCYLPDGRDLSAEMVKMGLALDWAKFSGGKYAHLEPEGARKKHWKAAARQKGHMSVFNK
jgi:micrococcal nuclease